MKLAHRIVFALAALTVGAGCTPALDINRVQPNVVDKKIFNGEWYFRTTVVDKQFHDSNIFIGYEGGLERVRWEVTEGQLIAFRSYERIPGSDPSNPGDQNVLAIFPITSHFDIRRQYNPTNGAETNVIEENTIDRPWWDRDYMRVDWSRNIALTADLSAFAGPINVNRNANNDPANPWKVRVSNDYIETTLDTMMEPDQRVCAYLDGSSGCDPAMVKLKLSFRKVDPTNDYVPLNYPDYTRPEVGVLVRADNGELIHTSVPATDGTLLERLCTSDEVGPTGVGTFLVTQVEGSDAVRMCNTNENFGDDPSDCFDIEGRCAETAPIFFAYGPEDVGTQCDVSVHDPDDCYQFTLPVFSRFGFFRTDRYAEDRENGWTLTGRERLINRWNVWKKSRNDDGSIIPAAARETKPIIYYLNVGYPTNLLGAADKLEQDWDVAFRDMVASVKGVPLSQVTEQLFDLRVNDCNIDNVNAFAAEHDLENVLSAHGIDEVAYGNLEQACAVLEHASTAQNLTDPSMPIFTWQQLGDLRYSFLNWTSKPELAGPLGYGPSAADPLTGEIISANANMYGTSVDTYANWGADVVDLINGKLTTEDIINGTQVREHLEAVRNRWSEKNSARDVATFERLFEDRTAHMDEDTYAKQVPLTSFNANLDRLAATDLEEQYLVTNEMVRMFSADARAQPGSAVTAQMIDQAQPSSWMRSSVPQQVVALAAGGAPVDDDRAAPGSDPSKLGAASKMAELADYLGRKNFCYLAQQTEPAIAQLAADLATEGKAREEIVQLIREAVFVGVAAHELGHTFGLRHNFEGSADPMNFFPEYWGVSKDALPEGKEHIAAKTTRTSELMYSSIMDYHQRFNGDWSGIGLYDKAAIKFGYGEMVEVFDEDEVNGNFVARSWLQNIFILGPSSIPYLVGGRTDSATGGNNADDKIDAAYNEAIDQYEDGDEFALLDVANDTNLLPKPQNLYKRKDIPMREWLRHEVLIRAYLGGYDNKDVLQNIGLLGDDGRAPRIAVPYSFCSDLHAWGGNLTCNRWDMGTTSQEIVTNAGEMYEFYYPFDAFRRDRALNPYASWQASYMNRVLTRTYQPMLNAFRYYYYYRRGSLRIFPTIRDWADAALTGMNFFTRVLQTPDTGRYCNDNGRYVPAGSVDECVEPLDIGLGVGREFNSAWDSEYLFRPINIGNYWDKVLALQSLTSSDAYFFRDFRELTSRGAFSIGYYRVFQPEMLRLFGDVILGDATNITPTVSRGTDGTLSLNYRKFINTDIFGQPIDENTDLYGRPIEAPLAGVPIEPSQSFQMRYWAMVFGMVNLTSTLDQTMDFASRARVTIAGSQSDPVRDETVVSSDAVIDFTDPTSGIIYRAAAVDGTETSVGYRVLEQVRDFADGPWADAKAALEAAEASGDLDAIDAAQTTFLEMDAELHERTQIVDFMVYIGNLLEYPGG